MGALLFSYGTNVMFVSCHLLYNPLESDYVTNTLLAQDVYVFTVTFKQ